MLLGGKEFESSFNETRDRVNFDEVCSLLEGEVKRKFSLSSSICFFLMSMSSLVGGALPDRRREAGS